MSDILYICNRKNPKCNKSDFCNVDCFHTQWEEYALNGPSINPEKEPLRFNKLDGPMGMIFFIEILPGKELN